jgi:hypothetical protein
MGFLSTAQGPKCSAKKTAIHQIRRTIEIDNIAAMGTNVSVKHGEPPNLLKGTIATMKSQKRTAETGDGATAYKKKKVIGNAGPSIRSSTEALASVSPVTETPLDYMLRVMRDPSTDDARRDAMAKAVLPYMHARLTTADGQALDDEGGTITFTWQPPQD